MKTELSAASRPPRPFLLHLAELDLEGNNAAERKALALIERTKEEAPAEDSVTTIIRQIVAPGSVTSALMPLRMAVMHDPYRETARMALERWLVEAALARMREPLSPADHRVVVEAARTPNKVRWPDWWSKYA